MNNIEVSSTGHINRVDYQFAFIVNEKFGNIFVPPSAVVQPNFLVQDLRKCFKSGDVVHFTALPQKEKNGCSWLATKVQLSCNNTIYQSTSTNIPTKNEKVYVTGVTETFAYAKNETLGNVFIPGAVFPQQEVTKVNAYVLVGDTLLVVVRPQALKSGCRWIAESASKPLSSFVDSPPNELELPSTASKKANLIGNGIISFISHDLVRVLDQDGNEVFCPILTWCGGDNNIANAEGLDDILSLGDEIHFEAVWSDICWKARKWSIKGFSSVADSFTQTAISREEIFIRTLSTEQYEDICSKIPNVMFFMKR